LPRAGSIGQAGQKADVNLKNAEAQRVPWEMQKAQLTAKQNAISQILQEKESGKFGDDVLLLAMAADRARQSHTGNNR
jgi:hypothetical protein